jgi:hypothetical protein
VLKGHPTAHHQTRSFTIGLGGYQAYDLTTSPLLTHEGLAWSAKPPRTPRRAGFFDLASRRSPLTPSCRRAGRPWAFRRWRSNWEGSHALLIATHDLAVDQAGPHLEVVHGLDHQRVAGRPVVPSARDQPDAHGVPPGHQAEAVVLYLVNPVGAGRGFVGGGREAGLDEFGVGGSRLRIRSINMSLI